MRTIPTVFLVDGDLQYFKMFRDEGWKVVSTLEEANLIQFTGGADVTPALYNQHAHPRSMYNPDRDKREQLMFRWGIEHATPMAGICRGGQFLNVMCGGQMWQDVTDHATGKLHMAQDARYKEIHFSVTSTHHQMMIQGPGSEVILIAKECSRREKCSPLNSPDEVIAAPGDGYDIEALYYKTEDCFCFQPHPEYKVQAPNLAKFYFDYIDEFFDLRA